MNKKIFEKSHWIWINNENNIDEYGEFFVDYLYNQGEITCNLSVDGDYTLFVNGEYVASNQYGDYPHYKIYDTINLNAFLKKGENQIKFLVWHYGIDTQRYKNQNPGIIFEILKDDKVEKVSNKEIKCCKSPCYKSGNNKLVSGQLGLSFLYDSTKENDYALKNSIAVSKNCTFYPRPNKKLCIGKGLAQNILKNDGNYLLLDLKKESFGLCTLHFRSQKVQKITVCWGENLENGHVRQKIGDRDFSFIYIAKKGQNDFTNYMLRLGCRYLEIFAESPIEPIYIGLYPQYYNVVEKPCYFKDPILKRIYDVSVDTLKNCMAEHYMDTPWREQCLYAFDGRNQMLCGYYAFENGNAEYAKSNLKLISEDRRDDNLLSICYPCGGDLTIPSFSLYYIVSVREYLEFTGDKDFVNSIYKKLISIVNVFLSNMGNGLILKFSGKNHWNFYDWSDFHEGNLGSDDKKEPDFMINALFIYAIKNLEFIAKYLDKDFPFYEITEKIIISLRKNFWAEDKKCYFSTISKEGFTVLDNAFALLSDVATKEQKEIIAQKIVTGQLLECSLSMKIFKYDALLKVDKDKYAKYVLDEIRKDYTFMLERGATSFWETIEGASAFYNAGSLCHGWSAIPIYFFKKLI